MELITRRNALLKMNPLKEYTVTGNPAVFNTNVEKSLTQFLVPFTPVQSGSGDPSPSNVRAISGWTGVTVGRSGTNVWDEQTEAGTISITTGANQTNNNQIRTKNYIQVVGGAEYCVVTAGGIASSDGIWVLFYDKNKGVISEGLPDGNAKATNARRFNNGTKMLVPENCAFVRWYFQSGYGASYKDDTSLNYPSTESTYHAYTGTTIPVTFPAVGKNLFNQTYYSDADNYTNLFSGYRYAGALNLKPNTTYTIKSDAVSNLESGLYCFVRIDGASGVYPVYNGKVSGSGVSNKFTTGTSGIIWFGVPAGTGMVDRIASIMSVNWQLEEGSTATAYEPYTNTVYGGYVDLVAGELVVTHVFRDLKATAISGTWDSQAGKGAFWYASGLTDAKNESDGVLCNRLKLVGNVSSNTMTNEIASYGSIVRWVELGTMEMTKTEYNSYLEEHPLHLTQKLVTPITYPLTPQQINTLIGDNTIWSDTNGTNTIKYLKKG